MAMPNAVKLFPRGYSGGQSQFKSRYTTRGGDAGINELWERYTSPVNQSTMWSFRKLGVMAAKRLLAGHPNWFIAQDLNPWVDEYNYQFVIDTLRFIGTGRRRMSVYIWRDLVSNAPAEGLEHVSARHDIADVFDQLKLTTSVDALIQLWCSQDGGFDDMMNTLNLLFGDLPVRELHTP